MSRTKTDSEGRLGRLIVESSGKHQQSVQLEWLSTMVREAAVALGIIAGMTHHAVTHTGQCAEKQQWSAQSWIGCLYDPLQGCCKRLPSGHDMVAVLTNSAGVITCTRLSPPTLHKDGEEALGVPCLPGSYRQLMVPERGRVIAQPLVNFPCTSK